MKGHTMYKSLFLLFVIVGLSLLGNSCDSSASAQVESASIPPGAAFAEVVPFDSTDVLIPISFGAVPVGMELVILQVRFPFLSSLTASFSLESRLPTPNEGTGPINLMFSNTPRNSATGFAEPTPTIDFPDGTVTVEEGRQLWLQFRNADFPPAQAGAASAISVLGYFRDRL